MEIKACSLATIRSGPKCTRSWLATTSRGCEIGRQAQRNGLRWYNSAYVGSFSRPVAHVRNSEVGEDGMLGNHYKDGLRTEVSRKEIFKQILDLLCRVLGYGPELCGEGLTDSGLRLDTVILTIC